MAEPTVADQLAFDALPEETRALAERVLHDKIEAELRDGDFGGELISAEEALTGAESKIEDALDELETAERNFADAKDALDRAIKRLKGNA